MAGVRATGSCCC